MNRKGLMLVLVSLLLGVHCQDAQLSGEQEYLLKLLKLFSDEGTSQPIPSISIDQVAPSNTPQDYEQFQRVITISGLVLRPDNGQDESASLEPIEEPEKVNLEVQKSAFITSEQLPKINSSVTSGAQQESEQQQEAVQESIPPPTLQDSIPSSYSTRISSTLVPNQYVVATMFASAVMVQDTSEPMVLNPIYNNLRFPPVMKSGQQVTQFKLSEEQQGDDENEQMSAFYVGRLPSIGCNPLWMGNQCLNNLLESTSFFYTALKRSGVMNEICAYSPLTILAPTDRSFAQLAFELGIIAEDLLLTQNRELLALILSLHVFPELELSPYEIIERSSLTPSELVSYLGQFVYMRADLAKNYVSFRPSQPLAPSAKVLFSASGQDIYLQEGCRVDYYYVTENVLIPYFNAVLDSFP